MIQMLDEQTKKSLEQLSKDIEKQLNDDRDERQKLEWRKKSEYFNKSKYWMRSYNGAMNQIYIIGNVIPNSGILTFTIYTYIDERYCGVKSSYEIIRFSSDLDTFIPITEEKFYEYLKKFHDELQKDLIKKAYHIEHNPDVTKLVDQIF